MIATFLFKAIFLFLLHLVCECFYRHYPV